MLLFFSLPRRLMPGWTSLRPLLMSGLPKRSSRSSRRAASRRQHSRSKTPSHDSAENDNAKTDDDAEANGNAERNAASSDTHAHPFWTSQAQTKDALRVSLVTSKQREAPSVLDLHNGSVESRRGVNDRYRERQSPSFLITPPGGMPLTTLSPPSFAQTWFIPSTASLALQLSTNHKREQNDVRPIAFEMAGLFRTPSWPANLDGPGNAERSRGRSIARPPAFLRKAKPVP